MPVRTDIGSTVKTLGNAVVTISSATTTNFDFGTPNDLDLSSLSTYDHEDRILIQFTASTAGTTDTVSFSVQDAADSAGSIGTPATASTSGDALTGGTGNQFALVSVNLAPDEPWLRCRVTSTGATDTFVTHCSVLAVPAALL